MEWMRILLNRCAGLFGGKRLDKQLDEEVRAHIEFAVEIFSSILVNFFKSIIRWRPIRCLV